MATTPLVLRSKLNDHFELPAHVPFSSLMALLVTSSMTSSSSSSVQLLYQTLFSLWSLSSPTCSLR